MRRIQPQAEVVYRVNGFRYGSIDDELAGVTFDILQKCVTFDTETKNYRKSDLRLVWRK